MRKVLALMVAVLLITGFAAAAFAWEIEMKGEWENRLRYFSRTGNNDLFGIASLQEAGAGTFVGFAGPNTWDTGAVAAANADNAGVIITRGGFSTWGSDAAIHDQKLTLIPTIQVNPAIRVHGVYTVGGYRNKFHQTSAGVSGVGVPPFERWYMHDSSPNAAYNTAGIGSWEQVRCTFTTPWAIFSIGIKDFPLGLGSNLAYNTRANAFLTVVPYGPFRFLHGLWLTDKAGASESYVMSPDRAGPNAQMAFFEGILFTYRNGPIEIGGGRIQALRHWGEGTPTLDVGIPGVQDLVLGQNLYYFKYSNGRFFANGEYLWQTNDIYRATTGPVMLAAAFNNGATQTYQELYNVFVETGVVIGPSKISLMWAQSSGPVLNNGNVNPAGFGLVFARNPKAYAPAPINYQAMEPYQYLMFYTYGGGNQNFHPDGTGQMADAYAFAGRYDYAVASNLNIYGTYIWAHRLEQNGTWFGQYASTGAVGVATVADAQALRGLYGAPAGNPFVSDGYIGWEANFGVDWKLLEGLTFKTRYAYWAPGDYFKEAFQAIGTRGGAVVANAMFLDRDAIQAIQGSILIEF